MKGWLTKRYGCDGLVWLVPFGGMLALIAFLLFICHEADKREAAQCRDVSPVGSKCIRDIGHDGRHRARNTYAGGIESWSSPTDWLPPGAGK